MQPKKSNPVKLLDPYAHDPKIEPRPYFRVDRFLSDLTGYVHYYGFPTSVEFRSILQLNDKYVPTEADLEAQRKRDQERAEFVARARQRAKEGTVIVTGTTKAAETPPKVRAQHSPSTGLVKTMPPEVPDHKRPAPPYHRADSKESESTIKGRTQPPAKVKKFAGRPMPKKAKRRTDK